MVSYCEMPRCDEDTGLLQCTCPAHGKVMAAVYRSRPWQSGGKDQANKKGVCAEHREPVGSKGVWCTACINNEDSAPYRWAANAAITAATEKHTNNRIWDNHKRSKKADYLHSRDHNMTEALYENKDRIIRNMNLLRWTGEQVTGCDPDSEHILEIAGKAIEDAIPNKSDGVNTSTNFGMWASGAKPEDKADEELFKKYDKALAGASEKAQELLLQA